MPSVRFRPGGRPTGPLPIAIASVRQVSRRRYGLRRMPEECSTTGGRALLGETPLLGSWAGEMRRPTGYEVGVAGDEGGILSVTACRWLWPVASAALGATRPARNAEGKASSRASTQPLGCVPCGLRALNAWGGALLERTAQGAGRRLHRAPSNGAASRQPVPSVAAG
jgi:hypothetical protein